MNKKNCKISSYFESLENRADLVAFLKKFSEEFNQKIN